MSKHRWEDKLMKNNQIGFKTSILSISILLTSANAIAGSIPGLKQEFNTVSATQIERLVTIPSVTVLIFVLLSTKITQWFTERQVVATGMITIFVAGVISYLAPSFWILYLARLLLGMGVGLFNAFAYSMISEYFDGDERQRLLGYEWAITSLGNIVMFIITAGLVLIVWRAVNLYYLITVPILVIFLWGTRKMPNSLQEQSTSESTTGQEIQRNPFSPKLILLFLLVMFSMFVSTTVVVKIADLVVG
ncbi:MFS transporter [Paucilactobacillus nenjiangensis]|uniref:MFS transporter n=2 Tax=Paucilactobacillus nenjiangensis TaxID=1296540 RepID=A0A5P1X577_9LACO|nr:MFS transporter [Paucilactobacillus nenjiangensis]